MGAWVTVNESWYEYRKLLSYSDVIDGKSNDGRGRDLRVRGPVSTVFAPSRDNLPQPGVKVCAEFGVGPEKCRLKCGDRR